MFSKRHARVLTQVPVTGLVWQGAVWVRVGSCWIRGPNSGPGVLITREDVSQALHGERGVSSEPEIGTQAGQVAPCHAFPPFPPLRLVRGWREARPAQRSPGGERVTPV